MPRPVALLVLLPLLACAPDEEAGTGSDPVHVGPGGGGAGGVPAPVVHAPPEPLAVAVLGPEVDAPADVRDLSVGPAGELWLAAADGLHVRRAGEAFLAAIPWAKSRAGAIPSSVAALGAGRAVIGYPDGPAQLATLQAGSASASGLPLGGAVGRLEADGGVVLAGTAAGLARVGAGGAVEGPSPLPSPSSAIWALAPAGPDVWVGDEYRLARLPGARAGATDAAPAPSVDLVPDAADSVVALAVCPNGELWASALGAGVFRLSASGAILEHLVAAAVLPQDHVLALACDLDGSVWIGTSWGGLARRTPGGAFRYYTAAAGLPGDSIRRLLVVPDGAGGRTLWMATDGGAAAYSGP
jgi:ligand-binding sensor domain-containing protein